MNVRVNCICLKFMSVSVHMIIQLNERIQTSFLTLISANQRSVTFFCCCCFSTDFCPVKSPVLTSNTGEGHLHHTS